MACVMSGDCVQRRALIGGASILGATFVALMLVSCSTGTTPRESSMSSVTFARGRDGNPQYCEATRGLLSASDLRPATEADSRDLIEHVYVPALSEMSMYAPPEVVPLIDSARQFLDGVATHPTSPPASDARANVKAEFYSWTRDFCRLSDHEMRDLQRYFGT